MKARLPDEYKTKGANNMNGMIKQAQKMQEDMKALQEELDAREHTLKAAGGLIELTMTGDLKLQAVKLSPDIVDKDNIDDLEDVIIAGVNAIVEKIVTENDAEKDKITNGLNIPGL